MKMTTEQQYLFESLKTQVPEEFWDDLRDKLEQHYYRLLPASVFDLYTLGRYIAETVHWNDPLPPWAWSCFDYEKFALTQNLNWILPLPDGSYIYILVD